MIPGPAHHRLRQAAAFGKMLYQKPHYVLGRFKSVRDAYAFINRLRFLARTGYSIEVGEKYGKRGGQPVVMCKIDDSGLVETTKTSAEHASAVREASVSFGITLKESAIRALHEAATELPLHIASRDDATWRRIQDSPSLRSDTAIATVRNAAQLEIVRKIASDRTLFDIASAALGFPPKTASVWLFWSLANALSRPDRESQNQTVVFHYDIDGFSFIYLNFYITNTDMNSGAHVYIEKTHGRKSFRQIFGTVRLTDEDAISLYGAHRLHIVSGPPGAGFVEDASCYHKALAPLTRDRLMFQIRFK
jgi:hypothetical protein